MSTKLSCSISIRVRKEGNFSNVPDMAILCNHVAWNRYITGNGYMLSSLIRQLVDNLRGCDVNDRVVMQMNA